MTDSDAVDRVRTGILLVCDEPERRAGYETILGGLGHEVVTTASDGDALDRVAGDEFAVVVLDAGTPETDAFESVARIRRCSQLAKTPIVVATEFRGSDAERSRTHELGEVDYVYVPVVPAVLRTRVASFVELRRARRELQTLTQRLFSAGTETSRTESALGAEVARRERLEETLLEITRRKDAFLALLAHELRNPLAPIVNAVEIMRLRDIENPELVWCRDVIDRQSKRMKRLVEDLLDISRVTQGEIPLQKSPVAIAAVVQRAIEIARPSIDARHHHLSIEQPLHPIVVEGDLARLAQAVGNLLDNAAKYTDEGGRIRVVVEELQRADGAPEVMIQVKDSGVGIASEALPHVFEIFAQGGWTPDRTQGGLGIGLTLVARLVELHGGVVAARSEGPGRGSEFEIRLPLIADRSGESRSKAGAHATPCDDSAQRVLVVDDDADAARSLALLLEASGSSVEIAYDGAEAVATADDFRPDVVLLDIGMPKLNGFGAARWIRGQSWARNVLLVALTGWGRDDVRSRMREAGFDAHMSKPVDLAALAALFANLPSGNRSGLVETR